MDIFISWSGQKSQKVAELFRDWLPSVIQSLNPYFTPKDIDKGQRWSQDIAGKLESSQFGIIILTKENLEAPWILFESGALSKHIGSSSVCPLLVDLKPTDVAGPLSQFQLTRITKDDIRHLLDTINEAMGESKISENTLDNTFEKWWPDLEETIIKVNEELVNDSFSEEIRSDRELLEEVLRLARHHEYDSFDRRDDFLQKLTYKPVTYSEERRTITVWLKEGSPYEIHLGQIDSGSELLDFILQINRKGRTKAAHIKAFVDCIEELTDRYFQTNAQGVFCPSGQNKEVDWPKD